MLSNCLKSNYSFLFGQIPIGCLGIVILIVTIFVRLLAEAYFLIVEQSDN
jgi:hypothetical protein